MQAESFAWINPLSSCIDLGMRLDCSYYSRSCDFDLTNSLDNPFKGCPQIPPPFREKAKSVCMPVDASPIGQPVLLRQNARTTPSDKLSFDLSPLWVLANTTGSSVSADAYWFGCPSCHSFHFNTWQRLKTNQRG